MAYLAVDKIVEGRKDVECIYSHEPVRINDKYGEYWGFDDEFSGIGYDVVELPKGSIKKLIGRDLTWEDEPIKIE